MDRFNCLAMAVVAGPAFRATAAQLAGSLGSAAVPRRADLLIAAAPLGDDGVLLRVAGLSVEQVGAALRQYLAIVPHAARGRSVGMRVRRGPKRPKAGVRGVERQRRLQPEEW